MNVGTKIGGLQAPPRALPGTAAPASPLPATPSPAGNAPLVGRPSATGTDNAAVRAPEPAAAAMKTVGQALTATASALGELASVAAKHPLGTVGVAGAATFVVGAFGLVSPFVGIMGGVVGISALMNGGGSARAED